MLDLARRQGYKPISRHYRWGIFLVSCLMILLCLLIFVIYISGALKQYYLDREYDSLSHTLESLGVLFDAADNYSKAILSDDIVQAILAYPAADRNADTITMRKQISRYMLSNRYFDAVPIYAAGDRFYDSGGITMLSDSWEEGFQIDRPTWRSYHKAPYIRIGGVRPEHVFSLIRPIYDYRNTAKIGVIEICIAERTITDLFLSNRAKRLYYLVNEENLIIAHPDRSLLQTADTVPLLADAVLFEGEDSFTLTRRSAQTGWYLKSTTAHNVVYEPIYRMLMVMAASGLVIICLGVAISAKAASAITRGITELTASVRQIDGLQGRLAPPRTRDETAILCDEFNAMLDKLEHASKQLVEEQRQKRTFQLELLQQQINPHFLYNTLENISSLAELGYSAEVVELVDNVARFYRGVLSKGNVLISLREELEIARSYLEILKIRSHEHFTYLFDVPPALTDNICIKLLLQPILENSIYHGFSGMRSDCHIVVSAREEGGQVLLRVTDNGKGLEPAAFTGILAQQDAGRRGQKSYGLTNIHQRLILYFGEDHGLGIDAGPGRGTSILLRLPREEWRGEKEADDDRGIVG